jgi:methyl-accepting chemotaxis protein/methyl-accepting chemotaxis protein-1 (serine sensor receptor)
MKDRQRELLKESQERSQSLQSQSLTVSTFMGGVLLAVAILAVLVVRNVSRTMARAVSQISVGADQVAAAAGQISAASQSLAQGSTEQAASIEETSASSEEITSMARRNSENSRAAASLVSGSQQKFVQTN